jgi:hypothetical protein
MAGRLAYAAGVFVVFGATAYLTGRSLLKDWRTRRDALDVFDLVHGIGAPVIAGLVATVGPVIILANR